MARARSPVSISVLIAVLASCEGSSTAATDTAAPPPDVPSTDTGDQPDTPEPEPDIVTPDPDVPDTTVVVEANVIEVVDQTITSKPPKLSARVTVAAFPKYLVIRDADGAIIGSERVWQKGPADYDVSVDLPPSWTPAALTAELYDADGNEPKLDAPVLSSDGSPVAVPFNATRPPKNSLTALDQTLTSFGYKITVEEVDVEELPAWLAVYEDDAGAPGALLGSLAVTTSPKVKQSVTLNRYVEPTETLWVAVHADLPADGQLTAADPALLEAPGTPLRNSIVVTNESCDGLTTKFCDPAKPGVISWLDRCGKTSTVTTSCGTGTCDDSGPYVRCRPAADPCAGNGGKTCVAADPHAVYWENGCGVPTTVAFPCGAAALCDDSGPDAECATQPTCAGNATLSCESSDPKRVFWRDHCGELNGNNIPCGATAVCDDSDGTATCVPDATCGGNTRLTCNPSDPENLYWLDACDELTGATLPCGAGLVCQEGDDDAHCIDPTPCDGPAQKVCNPADPSKIYWLDGCGAYKATTVPCGAGYACDATDGTATCKAKDTCGGNTTTTCLESDPTQVYWLDACGTLTGSTYPCGVATCDDSSGTAQCGKVGTCADVKRRVCDDIDATVIRLTDDCGDDLGVFSTCGGGKRCVEITPGEATCECVPSTEVACFGTDFLYEPSGIRKLDSCGNPSGEVVTTCELGQVCFYEGAEKTPVCTTSLSDPSGPMGHRGCSFIDYLTYKTDLAVDCRCRRHAADKTNFYGYDTSGNVHCMSQADSWGMGFTLGEGPHFRHLLHNFNGGGTLSADGKELFYTMHYTTPDFQKVGMVVGIMLANGNRRIVSGYYVGPSGMLGDYGSGYKSQRAVGVQRFETTTLPGAWDLERGTDGQLYVWGSVGGNQEITRVDPTTGLRTLVWRQALEGEPAEPQFGQCESSRLKATFASGKIPVQLQAHAFTMDTDGSFLLGFRNNTAEGNGIIRIAKDGSTCTVVSRWNGTMGDIGGGASPQYSAVEGYVVHEGKLWASVALGAGLLSVDLATGDRALLPLAPGSDELTPGQSTMFWDDTRDLLITAGGVQSYLGVAIDLTTGARQSLFRVGPGQLIPGPAPFDVNAHGAIDNGNYMGYGALVMDPNDSDILYFPAKWGLIAYEISTGNSFVMSQ